MYKTTTQNQQARSRRGSQGTLNLDQKKKRQEDNFQEFTHNDLKKFNDPSYRRKLGGWSIQRLSRLTARFQIFCGSCRHQTKEANSTSFVRSYSEATEIIQLIQLKKMLCCPNCGSKQIKIRIHVGREHIDW